MQKKPQFRVSTQPNISNQQHKQETQYQSHKKLKNLFYIKSKHTQRFYKNHSYFTPTQTNVQSRQLHQNNQSTNLNQIKRPSIINQERLKTQTKYYPQSSIYQKKTQSKQFVDCPTNYGLENTYKYLHDKSFLNNNEKYSKNRYNSIAKQKRRFSVSYSKTEMNQDDENSPQKNYMKNTAAYERKFLQTLSPGKDVLKKQESSNSFNLKLMTKRKTVFRISRGNSLTKEVKKILPKQLTEQRLPANDSLLHSRNLIYNASVAQFQKQPAKLQVCFIYGKRMKSYEQLPYRKISYDILPFLINTFLKCKIHYKDMTKNQFEFIKNSMKKVLQSSKKQEKYDIKDIINIGTIQGIIKFLENFQKKQNDYEWIQTIKYFFLIKDENVLQYQLNKVKEEVARLISIKYDAQFGQKQLFIFNIDKKQELTSFYDFLKEGKFLIGDDPRILQQYQKIQSQQNQQQSLQSKIKKWKSIASCQTTSAPLESKVTSSKSTLQRLDNQSTQSRKVIFSISKKLSEQKFNNLFQQFKVRQKKRVSKNLVNFQKVVVLKNHKSFVQRQKLKREYDIFE